MTISHPSSILLAALLTGATCGGAAWFVGRLFEDLPRPARLVTFRLLLLTSVLPWTFHAFYVFGTRAAEAALQAEAPAAAPAGALFAFAAAGLALLAGLLALCVWASRRQPPLSALLPLLLFAAYERLVLPLAGTEVALSRGVLLQALYVFSVGATVFLFIFARDLGPEDTGGRGRSA